MELFSKISHDLLSIIIDLLKGAKVVLGAKRHSLGMTFYEPTVLSDVKSDMLIARYTLE